ncbi:MAG: ABC transporter ATP-binding protein [Capsulimonadaceae bacterium]|nr:ABC transporter ATP-binding protein [Capsulimonadaceae bacterium]
MSCDAITISGLTKKYPSFTLGPLDLTVPRGAIYGLIGPNGAGKTTTIDLIFGMGKNDGGVIRVFDFDHQRDAVELKKRAAYVSPELNFQVWGKVGRAVRFVRGFFPEWDDEYCAELMKAFHIDANDKISTLSFGAKTKLSLLLALSRRPEVLILDEPTTGLDAVSKQQVFAELLKAVETGERTVLISSHGLSDLERFADHVGMIKNGKLLLEGRMDEIVDRFRLVEFFIDGDLPGRDGLIVLKQTGDRWHAVLDQNAGVEAWLQARGAQQLTLTRMTLEDLFIALVKEEDVQ